MSEAERQDLLRSLISLESPVDDVLSALQRFGWDSRELVTLTPEHIIAVLRRFMAGEFNARDVEHWADAIEGRDDIAMSDLLKDVLFDIANPVLQGQLDDARAEAQIARLRRG